MTVTAAVASTTTTSLITEVLNCFNEEFELNDYPKSTHYDVCVRYIKVGQDDLANDSFIRGAENDGYACCRHFLGLFHHESNNICLEVP